MYLNLTFCKGPNMVTFTIITEWKMTQYVHCLVLRPNYCARPKPFGSRGPLGYVTETH